MLKSKVTWSLGVSLLRLASSGARLGWDLGRFTFIFFLAGDIGTSSFFSCCLVTGFFTVRSFDADGVTGAWTLVGVAEGMSFPDLDA